MHTHACVPVCVSVCVCVCSCTRVLIFYLVSCFNAGFPVLRGFIAHRRGERDEMQDAFHIDDSFVSTLTSRPEAVYVCVCYKY